MTAVRRRPVVHEVGGANVTGAWHILDDHGRRAGQVARHVAGEGARDQCIGTTPRGHDYGDNLAGRFRQ